MRVLHHFEKVFFTVIFRRGKSILTLKIPRNDHFFFLISVFMYTNCRIPASTV